MFIIMGFLKKLKNIFKEDRNEGEAWGKKEIPLSELSGKIEERKKENIGKEPKIKEQII